MGHEPATAVWQILAIGLLVWAFPAVAGDDALRAFQEGRLKHQAEDYSGAVAAFEHAVELAPEDSQYRGWLGRSYGLLAERKKSPFVALKSRHALERAVVLDGCNIEALSDLMKFYAGAPFFLGGSSGKATAIRQCLGAHSCPCAFGLDP